MPESTKVEAAKPTKETKDAKEDDKNDLVSYHKSHSYSDLRLVLFQSDSVFKLPIIFNK